MKRLLKLILLKIPICLIALSLLYVLALKWVPVKVTPLMIERRLEGIKKPVRNNWVKLEDISPNLVRAAIASEDARFFEHNGFDFIELKKMKELHDKKGKPIRGCSTISQQTAKNCFTWCTHTWARKISEACFTVLIEHIWGKRRILEVYLNCIEFGPGLYGADAAANFHYRKAPSKLTLSESASLICCLPNPIKRNPKWVERHMAKRRAAIIKAACQTRLEYD